MQIDIPTIETKRLILREIMLEDCHDMFEYAKLPYIGPVAGWETHRSINETKTVIQMFRDKKKYGQLGVFAIVWKETNKMIGTLELHTNPRRTTRPVSYYAFFKGWLLLSQPPGCLSLPTSFPT